VSRVSAVVVTWRAGVHAAACLDRIAEVEPELDVVLVDNESEPAALGRLLDGRGRVEAVPLARNTGLAGGANAGIERAFADGASHALLLNDDVLLEPGCVAALLESAGDGAAAAPTIDAPGAEAFAGAAIDWRRGFGRHEPGALDYLTAAALLVPVGVWERVGPFDASLFLYYEDVDWSLRARAAGVPLRVASAARASHVGGASTGGGAGPTWGYYSTRNRLRLLEARRGRGVARREAAGTALRALGRLAIGPQRGVARAKLRGVGDYLAGRSGQGPYPR
jgi:GT2 family glycosyltransferase